MNVWHLTPDAVRDPHRISAGQEVHLWIGTWPIEPDQTVAVICETERVSGEKETRHAVVEWRFNRGPNSYWETSIGPFMDGDRVAYTVRGRSTEGDVELSPHGFEVGPKVFLALLWHQHQPLYKDTSSPMQEGSYVQPWVRLHAIRDYYSMAALAAPYPDLHLTVNLTPVLLWQIEDYVDRGATDQALELTLRPAELLDDEEREYVLSNFFDAHWHHQIFPHPRYKELFEQRQQSRAFSAQDMRDLQMWFNLAWFAEEFRIGDVQLVTGETVRVRRFVEKQRGYTTNDIAEMVECQYRILRAIVPIHRQMQDRGQIEVSTTPFFHPILPLLVDTDRSTIDRRGGARPKRFAYPEDAQTHVAMAVNHYTRWFGKPPHGMWPAEGAVSQSTVPAFAKAGIQWIASDQGVLQRSGRFGYRVEDPDVLCRPYRAEEGASALGIYFRSIALSDDIGFHYHHYENYEQAASDFLTQIKHRFSARGLEDDRIVSVILDGENAWSSYREDARPFLKALYERLQQDREIRTVTFSEYLEGNPTRGVSTHPLTDQPKVFDLFAGSWIDELGSEPGSDFGTWIGEREENEAWDLLGQVRRLLQDKDLQPDGALDRFPAVYAAEGSDWFWWFGADQDSGNDDEFDDLFRIHLKSAYRQADLAPPQELDRHIVPHAVLWTFAHQVSRVQRSDRLTVRTNCSGNLTWSLDGEPAQTASLSPSGGVMAGVRRYHLTLGPFEARHSVLSFSFHCTYQGCPGGNEVCCRQDIFRVELI